MASDDNKLILKNKVNDYSRLDRNENIYSKAFDSTDEMTNSRGLSSKGTNEHKTYTITILQPESEAIIRVITYDNFNITTLHTSTFTAPADTVYSVEFKDNHNPDGLFLSSTGKGKLVRDVTIQAYPPSKLDSLHLITLLQSEYQTIIAYEMKEDENGVLRYTGESYTNSFWAKYGTRWRFTVIPDKSQGDHYLSIVQSDHQLITVRAFSPPQDTRAGVLVKYPDDDTKTMYPENDNEPYEYLICRQNCRVFATGAYDTAAKGMTYRVTIKQQKHTQLYVYSQSGIYSSSVDLPKGSIIEVRVVGSSLFDTANIIIDGVIEGNGPVSYTLDSDITISTVSPNPIGTKRYLLPLKEFDITRESKRWESSRSNLYVATPYASNHAKNKVIEVYAYDNDAVDSKRANSIDIETNSNVESFSYSHIPESGDSNDFLSSYSDSFHLGKSYFIQNMLTNIYGYPYFIGWDKRFEPSINMENKIGDDVIYPVVIGFAFDTPNREDPINSPSITSESDGKWVVGFNIKSKNGINIFDIIDNIKLFIFGPSKDFPNIQDAECKSILRKFKYTKLYHNTNKDQFETVVIYTMDTTDGPNDTSYLQLLSKDTIPMSVGFEIIGG